MDDANPFMVDMPRDGEKLDLSPILMPLLHAIRTEMESHELRCHWGNGPKKVEPLLPEDMYAYMVTAIEGVEYNRLIVSIHREAIISWLKENNYKPEDKSEYCFRLYNDERVWVYGPRDEMNYIKKHEAICKMARAKSKTRLEMAREVEARSNVLDRIAAKL